MHIPPRRLRPLFPLLLTACSSGGGATVDREDALAVDAANDARIVDADAPDVVSPDARPADASQPAPDAQPSDAGAADAGPPDAAEGTPTGTLGADAYTLEVRTAPFGLLVKRGGTTVARLRAIEVAFADTEEMANDRRVYFDPLKPQTYHVEWRTLDAVGAVGADGLPTTLGAGDFQAGLQLAVGASGQFDVALLPDTPGRLVQIRLVLDAPDAAAAPPGSARVAEDYYGLGELFDQPSHRGQHRPMQIGPDFQSEGGYSEHHVTVPLLIGTQGWGVFVEDRRPADFDVAASDPQHIVITYEAKALRFHLLVADTPIDVLPNYIALTGQPARPAEWAFGGLIWRNEYRDQAQVLDDAAQIRANDLPMSGLWLDRPWATDLNTFIPDPAKFPDVPGMVETLHASGLRLAAWASPYLEPSTGELWQTAHDNDWFIHGPDGWPKPFDEAAFVDLTNPAARTFFSGLIQRATDLGVEGFKLDYGEDVQVGIGPVATSFDFFNGQTERTMHHGIALDYHLPFSTLTGGDNHGFVLSRAGTYGDQTLTTTIWPGDLCNGFEHHKESRHVGGLPAAISGGLSLSTSGYPFYASDTGGYRHGRATKTVFLRWLAYSALGSQLQTGGSAQHNPWDFTPYDTGRPGDPVSQFDAETLSIYRDFARLYIRLHAYRHPFNEDAHETGRPVTRPLGFIYPELGVHPATEYMLGDALLVAPATDETGAVEIVVPPGRWYDWYTDEAIDGPTTLQRVVPLDHVSLLVRAGAIVPMLRPTVDTLAAATDADVDSYANDPGVLTVRLYPGEGERSFDTLGDTHITVNAAQATITGDHFTGYDFELHQPGQAPTHVVVGAGAQTVDLATP